MAGSAGDAGPAGPPLTALRLLVGAYTQPEPHAPDANGRGISLFHFDPAGGGLEERSLAAELPNPSFLAAHPNGRAVYALSELEAGRLSAFGVGPQGLSPLNSRSTEGSAPAHVSVDPLGRFVFAANYASGASVALFPILPDGSLGPLAASARHQGHGPVEDRQDGPHAHCVCPAPDGRHLYAADLGTDEVVVYAVNDVAPQLTQLGELRLPPGSGPRHLSVHPDGRTAYLTLELSGQLAVLGRDPASGGLDLRQLLPTGPLPADPAVSPDGRFVYAASRGDNRISAFTVTPDTGELSPLETVPALGRTPRSAALSPDGAFLLAANQDSDTVAVYRRDAQSGRLTDGRTVDCPTPTCFCFLDVADGTQVR